MEDRAFVTTVPLKTGYGHQAKDAISAIVIARLFGLHYIHSPTNTFIDDFLNLKSFGVSPNSLPTKTISSTLNLPTWAGLEYAQLQEEINRLKASHGRPLLIQLKSGTRVHLFQLHQWLSQSLISKDLFSNIRNDLQLAFAASMPYENRCFSPDKLNVAIHIRRGDIAIPQRSLAAKLVSGHPFLSDTLLQFLQRRGGRHPSQQHYCFPTRFYSNIMRDIRKHYRDTPLRFHIFTEELNSRDVLKAFQSKKDCTLYIGNSETSDFVRMVSSDILVVSNSSFSQIAGYYSKGIKLYFPNEQYRSLPTKEFFPLRKNGKRTTAGTKLAKSGPRSQPLEPVSALLN